MDFRTLKQFLTLAETLHFGRASELCHISTSALSRSIKQLEQHLNAELFERDNRTVSLTGEGEKFLPYARDAIDQWESIQLQLMQSGPLKGEISVYCSVTASYSFLYEILTNFRQQHPGIEIKLHTGDPDLAISRVQAGQEEISITARPDHLPVGLEFKQIAQCPLVFIAPQQPSNLDHLLTTQPNWSEIPMIFPEGGVSRREVNKWFQQQKIKPTIYAQVAGNEAIVSMVSLGFGIGIVPLIVLENSPLSARVRILEVNPALPPHVVGLFVLEKKLKNPIINAFWQQLKPR